MPERCVAKHCSNAPSKLISLHQFPKDKKTLTLWRKFVQVKRDKWRETPKSVLCSAHFERDAFKNYTMVEMGYTSKLFLLPGAIPTIHAEDPGQTCNASKDTSQAIPAAIRKRDVIQVSPNSEINDVKSALILFSFSYACFIAETDLNI